MPNFTTLGGAPSANAPRLAQSQGLKSDIADVQAVAGLLETREEKSKAKKRKGQFQRAFGELMKSDKPFGTKEWGALSQIDPKTTQQALEVMKGVRGLQNDEQAFVLKGAEKASDMVGRFLLSVRQIEDPTQRQQLILTRLKEMQGHDNAFVREAGATLYDDFRSMAQESQNTGRPFDLDDNMVDVLLSRYSIFGDVFKHEAEVRQSEVEHKRTLEQDRLQTADKRAAATTAYGRKQQGATEADRRAQEAATTAHQRGFEGKALTQAQTLERDRIQASTKAQAATTAQGRKVENIYTAEQARSTGGVRPLAPGSPEMSMLPGAGGAVRAPAPTPQPVLDSPIARIRRAAGGGNPTTESVQGRDPETIRQFRERFYEPGSVEELGLPMDRIIPEEEGLFRRWMSEGQ